MLTLSLGCAADPGIPLGAGLGLVCCCRIIRKPIYTIQYTAYEALADNIHYPILKARGGCGSRVQKCPILIFTYVIELDKTYQMQKVGG